MIATNRNAYPCREIEIAERLTGKKESGRFKEIPNTIKLKIIDEIIYEPIGGAHRNTEILCDKIKEGILKNYKSLKLVNYSDLRDQRNKRYLDYII